MFKKKKKRQYNKRDRNYWSKKDNKTPILAAVGTVGTVGAAGLTLAALKRKGAIRKLKELISPTKAKVTQAVSDSKDVVVDKATKNIKKKATSTVKNSGTVKSTSPKNVTPKAANTKKKVNTTKAVNSNKSKPKDLKRLTSSNSNKTTKVNKRLEALDKIIKDSFLDRKSKTPKLKTIDKLDRLDKNGNVAKQIVDRIKRRNKKVREWSGDLDLLAKDIQDIQKDQSAISNVGINSILVKKDNPYIKGRLRQYQDREFEIPSAETFKNFLQNKERARKASDLPMTKVKLKDLKKTLERQFNSTNMDSYEAQEYLTLANLKATNTLTPDIQYLSALDSKTRNLIDATRLNNVQDHRILLQASNQILKDSSQRNELYSPKQLKNLESVVNKRKYKGNLYNAETEDFKRILDVVLADSQEDVLGKTILKKKGKKAINYLDRKKAKENTDIYRDSDLVKTVDDEGIASVNEKSFVPKKANLSDSKVLLGLLKDTKTPTKKDLVDSKYDAERFIRQALDKDKIPKTKESLEKLSTEKSLEQIVKLPKTLGGSNKRDDAYNWYIDEYFKFNKNPNRMLISTFQKTKDGKRKRPKRHTRTTPSGKKVLVNPKVKETELKTRAYRNIASPTAALLRELRGIPNATKRAIDILKELKGRKGIKQKDIRDATSTVRGGTGLLKDIRGLTR